MSETKDILKRTLQTLNQRKAEIDAKVTPLVEKRESLWEKIHGLKAEVKAIAAKEKAIRGDDYHLLCQEIGQLAVKLGGKSLSGQ